MTTISFNISHLFSQEYVLFRLCESDILTNALTIHVH